MDVDKLKTGPTHLSKLSNVVGNDDVKKTAYNVLVTKANVLDTSTFVLKTRYFTNIGLKRNIVLKRMMILTRKYLLLVDLLRKQIIIQKLMR